MRGLLAVILVVAGVLGLVVGVLYLTEAVGSLPTFLPGYVAHASGKLTKHGIAAVVIGAVLLALGIVAAAGRRR